MLDSTTHSPQGGVVAAFGVPSRCAIGHYREASRLRMGLALTVLLLASCQDAGPPLVMPPQTIVLFATPKILPDFANPDSAIAAFLDNYAPLTSRAARTIVIFAVGNSDHILMYRGSGFRQDGVEWARYTDGLPVDNRTMTLSQLDGIVKAFKIRAATLGITLKVFDQVDSGVEFADNPFKWGRHAECMDWQFESFNIRAKMKADTFTYATRPNGIEQDTECGTFLVDQVAAYMADFGFDGILYDNQLGTRGKWLPDNGPGYSDVEAAAITSFFKYSQEKYGSRELMWFDSYNNTDVERSTWSVPEASYHEMDYIIASGFCVVTFTHRYRDNLASKLRIADGPPVLATLDYVDPWYTYNSMTAFPGESAELEEIAINNRFRVGGVVFFANDQLGRLVPRVRIQLFAARYFTGP